MATRNDLAEAAAVLRRLVAALEAGTLTAPPSTIARMQGVVVALDTQLRR